VSSPSPSDAPAQSDSRSLETRQLHLAISQQIDRDLGLRGQIALPCNPKAIDANVAGFAKIFRLLGRPFGKSDAAVLRDKLSATLAASETEDSINSFALVFSSEGYGLRYRIASSSAKLDTVAFNGTVVIPAIPSLGDGFCQRLVALFALLDRPSSQPEAEALRQRLADALQRAYTATPQTRVTIRYESTPPPDKRVACQIEPTRISLATRAEALLEARPDYLESLVPQAKVTDLLAARDPAGDGEALVLGVATAQYALPLLADGWEVTALDLAAPFAERLQDLALVCGGEITATNANFFNPELTLKEDICDVTIAHNFTTRMQDVRLLREFLRKLAPTMKVGGVGAIEIFVAADGYVPDAIAIEAARAASSTIFTRDAIAAAFNELPFAAIELTHALAYEAQHRAESAPHLEPEYVNWASGRQVFALETPPIALHWLTFQRTDAPMPDGEADGMQSGSTTAEPDR